MSDDKSTNSNDEPIAGDAPEAIIDDGQDAELAAMAEEAVSPEAVARFDVDAPKHRAAADSRGKTLSHAEFKKVSRRAVLTGAVPAAAAVAGWFGLQKRAAVDRNIPNILRSGHEVNEGIWRALFRENALAPTFAYEESSELRVNGRWGIRDELNLANWRLRVVGRSGDVIGTHVIDDLREMPQTEMTIEHKCVEGWSHVVTWGGVTFREFVERFYPEEADAKFVGLATPLVSNPEDRNYNVGLDMPSMMHSQTMLTLDLQREPLSQDHGAPLRLTTPLKYGTKQIKRIGSIQFSDTQPENDYWTVRGYDWYAAL